MEAWRGDFGRAYTDRNGLGVEALDRLYVRYFGTPRSTMNRMFVEPIPRSAVVLEVGANVGNQLRALAALGFENLYGVELQDHALRLSRATGPRLGMVQGSALDLPFADGACDLVFTSGVLIHIAPEDLPRVMDEVHRCTRRYIWGFEYHAPRLTPVHYRGHQGLLWKDDFAQRYLERFDDLSLVQRRLFHHIGSENRDAMFLLEKSPAT
jgi:pseudaminic acid biosynthesis-associated methylase